MKPENADLDETSPKGMLYVVQAGAYKSLNNAKAFKKKFEKMGVVSEIKLYRIDEGTAH